MQCVVKYHCLSTAGLPVEKDALPHSATEHCFQAQRLRAQLHLVCTVDLRAAALVLHRHGTLNTVFRPELDDVRHPNKAQFRAGQRHCGNRAYSMTALHPRSVGTIMQQSSFGGMAVFGPQTLDVNQRALTRAV